jgi:hypothetical protein
MSATATNPHWVGNEPAWDIVLTNGDTHRNITRKEIWAAIMDLKREGKVFVPAYSEHIDVVRQYHIDFYNTHHTMN